MIEKLTKSLTQFYQISFVMIMLATLGVVFYFWRLGFIDGSRSKDLHKAGFTLERLTEQNALSDIKSFILKEDAKKSLERIKEVKSEMKQLNRLVEDQSYEVAIDELSRLQTGVANLISFQKSAKVLSVFNSKMDGFADFVKENNWRTLTRMSERVLSLSKNPLSPGSLGKVVRRIDKDFDSMIRITENSILSNEDKERIKSKIQNLRVETKMLKRHLDERALSLSLADSFETVFNQWIGNISPELSYQKLQVERMGRYYVMGILGILGLTFSLFFSGFIFNRWALRRSQALLETGIKELVADGIIGREKYQSENFSSDFQEFSKRTGEYVNKRMSFGSIFQEAMPFSSIMLDKNLKLEWANKQFCEDWEMSEEDAAQDFMSWDYLAKMTNLGHNDPVLEAIKNDVAGIYQIQVKTSDSAQTRPYEMFVSPVRHEGDKKVMLFFYPLMSMRETIKEQAVSIVNPIDKTLRSMIDGGFETCDKDQLRKEYEVGGISRILDMFERLADKEQEEREEFLNQIETLHIYLEQFRSSAEEAFELNSQSNEISKSQISDLKVFKDGVINLSESTKELENFCSEFGAQFEETLSELDAFQSDFYTLKNSVEDMALSLPNLDALKEDVRSQRSKVSESKAKLGQALASFIHIKKGLRQPEIVKKFQAAYEKVGDYFEQLESAQTSLDRKLVQLEVSLSKAQMLVNSAHKNSDSLNCSQNFQALKLKREERQNSAQAMSKARNFGGSGFGGSSQAEEIIIESLKSIYSSQKANLGRQALIARSLDLSENRKLTGLQSVNSVSEAKM